MKKFTWPRSTGTESDFAQAKASRTGGNAPTWVVRTNARASHEARLPLNATWVVCWSQVHAKLLADRIG